MNPPPQNKAVSPERTGTINQGELGQIGSALICSVLISFPKGVGHFFFFLPDTLSDFFQPLLLVFADLISQLVTFFFLARTKMFRKVL